MIQTVGPYTRYSKKTQAVYSPDVKAWSDLGFNEANNSLWGIKYGNYLPIMGRHTGGLDIAPWGPDNLEPLRLIKAMKESNITPQLLMTLVNFACGEKCFTYKEDLQRDEKTGQLKIVPVPVSNPDLKMWMHGIKTESLMRKRATDYYFSGNLTNLMVLSRKPEKYGIAWIDHIDACDWRPERINKSTRRIEHHYLCADWTRPHYTPKSDKGNVIRYKNWKQSDPIKYYRSLHHSKLYWPGQKYYGVQPWHSAKNWITFANKIPVWMDANISNSSNIKYHVQWPADYFDYTLDWSKEEQKKEEDRVFNMMDDFLAGEKNVGKAFYSRVKYDPMTGKSIGGWKIEPVKADVNDKAWLDNYKTSLGAMTGAFDVTPALANIPLEGKFAISGSNLRIAYQLHIALKVAAARSLMVEPLEMAYQVNHDLGVPGFSDPEIKFGFINKNVLTLAENKAGMDDGQQPNQNQE